MSIWAASIEMKQFIVMSAMVMLGIFIYNMIAGTGEGSLINELAGFFKNEIESRGATH